VTCDSTTRGPEMDRAPPPMRTETNCSGGTVVPGTEGHVLQLSIAFLDSQEAAAKPSAVSVYQFLGIPDLQRTPGGLSANGAPQPPMPAATPDGATRSTPQSSASPPGAPR
jgi:hypothetical protein